jgi:hypothetical protein
VRLTNISLPWAKPIGDDDRSGERLALAAREKTMAQMKFPLGAGPAATALIVLMLLVAGAYFGYAGLANITEPVLISGREVVGREGVRIGLFAVAALLGGAGLVLLLRTLRNFGREKFVALDANRMVLSGFDLGGGERVIGYGEIVQVLEYKVRGMPVIEIVPRGGDKVLFGSVLFRSSEAFERFRRELGARLPHLGR